jgi:hypothetical protein
MKLASLLALCLLSSVAAAQPGQAPPPPPPGYGAPAYGPPAPGYGPAYEPPGTHTHDGFYLRMFLGFGYTNMELEDQDVSVGGTGGAFGIALGAAVSENLIVFAEIFDDIAMNPTLKQGGTEFEGNDISAGVVAVGGGIAYYFMPSNVYVSGTLSWGQLTVRDTENNEEIGESEFGPGLSLMVGKEWWVSPNWGLGGALQIYGGRMKDKGDNAPTWATQAIALTSSATYN